MSTIVFNQLIGLALSARNMDELLDLIERPKGDLSEGSPEQQSGEALARKARRYVAEQRAGIEAN